MKKQYLISIAAVMCLVGCNSGNGSTTQPSEAKITSISVSTLPKVTYKSGEKIDLTGLKVEANLSDGTKKDVSSFTTNADTEKVLKVGKEEVKVFYVDGENTFETSFVVNVNTYFHEDYNIARQNYTDAILISPMDGVTIDDTNHVITFSPASEGEEYEVSGYFKGQLKNTVKNTTFKFNNAFIENDDGVSAIYSDIKTKISFKSETVSYIVMNGKDEDGIYKAAFQVNKKNIEIGGSGTGYIISVDSQCVKGDEIEIKGSGKFYFEGCETDSVVSCNNLIVGEEKTFEMFVSNGKNGIKADKGIDISSGTYNFADNKTALKVDDSGDVEKPYLINLNGGIFNMHLNDSIYSCANDCFVKNDNVEIKYF